MEQQVRIEVPSAKVERIEYDFESDTATVYWSDGKVENVIVLEFVYGAQGTWARLYNPEVPNRVICVGQSGTMPSVTYIVYEEVVLSEEIPEPVAEEVSPEWQQSPA